MKLVRVGERGQELHAASVDGQLAYILDGVSSFAEEGAVETARHLLADPRGADRLELSSTRIGAPLVNPGKIIGIGLNYRRHASEAKMRIPDEPILFMKAPYTVNGPYDDVVIPPGSRKTDYEIELAVVIGSTARYLPSPDRALSHVLGYAVANDVSERTFQLERGGQWDKGKNCATFSPLGPFLVTADEVPDPQALGLHLRVNGETRQDSVTADMIFPVDHLVWYVSQFMTLLLGDIILTGTPEGVGAGFASERFLQHGDLVTASIDGLGTQSHRFAECASTREAAG